MGIEPTQDRSTAPRLVLKTRSTTRHHPPPESATYRVLLTAFIIALQILSGNKTVLKYAYSFWPVILAVPLFVPLYFLNFILYFRGINSKSENLKNIFTIQVVVLCILMSFFIKQIGEVDMNA